MYRVPGTRYVKSPPLRGVKVWGKRVVGVKEGAGGSITPHERQYYRCEKEDRPDSIVSNASFEGCQRACL